MLEKKITKKVQKRIYENYKRNKHNPFTRIGRWLFTIEYNPLAEIHTWIMVSKDNGKSWEWRQPLDSSIWR